MYSYNRPTNDFWQGFYTGLRKRGLTHKQAIEEMQSKGTRWLFDNLNEVYELGEKVAAEYSLCVTGK